LKAKVHITLKNGVLDPQGKAVEHALHGMGFNGVGGVRQGKYIEVDLPKGGDKAQAKTQVEDMCRKLLANTVIENFSVEVVD
jgi:phosphoribosylformylglycinamidine synthase